MTEETGIRVDAAFEFRCQFCDVVKITKELVPIGDFEVSIPFGWAVVVLTAARHGDRANCERLACPDHPVEYFKPAFCKPDSLKSENSGGSNVTSR